MYDTITIDPAIPMPEPVWRRDRNEESGLLLPSGDSIDPHSLTYQTKDLIAPCLFAYRLSSDGYLERRQVQSKWIDGDAGAESMMDKLGYAEELPGTERWVVEESFVGRVRFYDFMSQVPGVTDLAGWLEYEMVLVDGRLHRAIKLVDSYARSNVERKRRSKALFEDLARRVVTDDRT